MQSTAWDGSLVSLPSLNNSLISLPNSSRDTSPERTPHDLRHPLADALTTGETDSDASKSMNSSLNNNNSDSDPSNPLSPSPPLSSLPSPLSSSDLPPALLHLHAPSPHPLSAFLLSGLSPPNSPLSSVFSYSHDGSPGRGVGRWRRRRSSTNGSSARSTSGSGGGHSHNGGDTGGFVMPSMRLPQLEHGEHDSEFSGAASGGSGAEDGKLKVLVLGHGIAERKALERLLGERGGGGGDADLSMSMLSARLSERSNSNSNNHGGHDGLLDEFHSTTATFFHPSTDIEASELGGKLETKLEQLEKLLNPAYPSSQKLATLALSGLRGEMDCCLMLFSSPPLASEVSFARIISLVLPLFPVLVLPPPPTSRPQKTSALVDAVQLQLTSAGVRWCSAFETLAGTTTKQSTFYLLPSLLLEPNNSQSSGPSSLTSSQELRPPSPGFSSDRSSSPASINRGDLDRLRELVGTQSSRERIRRNRAIAFLDWREVELAARGGAVWDAEKLMREGRDAPVNEGERRDQIGLDFSRRVGERREVLKKPVSHIRDNDVAFFLDSSPASPPQSFSRAADSSFASEPATPKCSQRYLPSNSSNSSSADSLLSPIRQDMDLASSYFGTSALAEAGDAARGSDNLRVIDPFHLPSLMSLVGLNLRLHLLPPPITAGVGVNEKSGGGTRSWMGTAMLFSALFVAGFVCGSQRVGIWRLAG